MKLLARQKSEVATVVFEPGFLGGPSSWGIYTTSQGGTKWDERSFKTEEQAVAAAREAGFTVKVDRTGSCKKES